MIKTWKQRDKHLCGPFANKDIPNLKAAEENTKRKTWKVELKGKYETSASQKIERLQLNANPKYQEGNLLQEQTRYLHPSIMNSEFRQFIKKHAKIFIE